MWEEKHRTWLSMIEWLYNPGQVCLPHWTCLHFCKMGMCQVPHRLVMRIEWDDKENTWQTLKTCYSKWCHRPAASASLRSSLERQISGPDPRSTESESVLQQAPQVSHKHIKFEKLCSKAPNKCSLLQFGALFSLHIPPMRYNTATFQGLGLLKGFYILLSWALMSVPSVGLQLPPIWPSRLFLESSSICSGKDHLREALPCKILGHFWVRRTNKMQTHIFITVSALGKVVKYETEGE